MEQRVETPSRYTVEDYFRLEAATDERLEFRDGQVVAMSGGSVNHSRIAHNIGREMGNRLTGTPCEAFEAELRVRITRRTEYSHPDVTVVCGGTLIDPDDALGETVLNPRLVFEVLSPSTELYDRTRKADGYRDVESLQEYVLVSQQQPRAETFYRNVDGVWSIGPTVAGLNGVVRLRSVGIELPLAEVYARVSFPAEPPAADR